ncbi:unnamed protein product [Arabidopsis thaliana]|uniref:(thale cress) hypothetical protein n=1 Tax=Arabidopsis thaliana TaxID=3702 RepID=A0A7G2ERC2_ARATH|nr:unnamed protein product [Arabidopsis thaliana]
MKIEGHEHLLSNVNDHDHRRSQYELYEFRSTTDHDCLKCDACDQVYGDGFSCDKCKFTVHWKCAFVFKIQEIYDHPSHDGHCLKLLTTGAPNHTDPKCHICGKNTKRLLYRCSVCKLNVDIDCIFDAMSARAHLNMSWHHHPLLLVDLGFDMFCEACDKYESKYCSIPVPFIHGSHPHPLLYLELRKTSQMKTCQCCGNDEREVVLGCVKCNYFLDFRCATLPLTVKLPRFAKSGGKISEYQLKLLLNNRSSRPFCYNCKCRCPGPFILRDRYYSIFYCSFYCCRVFQTRIGKMLSIIDKVICPPWVLEHNT